jgi:hypothetical protein
MKRVFSLALFLFLAALAFAATAHAQSPSGADPATAIYINGAPQSIPANSTRWYKFDYVGDKSKITVLMPGGTDTLVEFNAFTPEQANSWWDGETKPIGRGTAYPVDCETGEEVLHSECKSRDLKWVGQFNFPGTFFIQVVNYNTGTANFTLTIDGTGVRVPAAAPSTPVITPTPAPLLPTTGGIWQMPSFPPPLPFKLESLW